MVWPTSAVRKGVVEGEGADLVGPRIFKKKLIAPRPSASASVFDAVSTWPLDALPLIVTVPVGGSLTLVTADVAALALLSAVPWPSVYLATTSMVWPTSGLASRRLGPVGPARLAPSRCH